MRAARPSAPRPAARRIRQAGISTTILALALGTALAGPARAHRPPPESGWSREARAAGSLVDVQVLVDGTRVPLFASPRFDGRRYFEAERGRNYALTIHNRTGRRIAVLLAVDGLNVVNGARSSLGRDEPMYVLGPWETASIRGWRTSLEHVQQFVFVDEERSYASRTGQANGDMGWIRVLAFEEERPVAVCPPVPDRLEEHSERARGTAGDAPAWGMGAPQAKAPAEVQKQATGESYAGTGWGKQRRDPVREVEFTPVALASDHLVLRYEYARALAALGIFPDENRLGERERGEIHFARPPLW
jgi:hypothetical protein